MATALNDRVRQVCKKHLIPHPYIPTNAGQSTLVKLLDLDTYREEFVKDFPAVKNLEELYLWAFEAKGSRTRIIYLDMRLSLIEYLKALQPATETIQPIDQPITAVDADRLLEERLEASVPLVTAFLDWAKALWSGRGVLVGK
jgi:hypothetical protein